MPIRALLIAVAAFAAILPATTPAMAQQGARVSDSFENLMRDFVHYIRIDKPDLAADIGQVILAKGMTARDFSAAIEDANLYSDFEDALGKALQYPELEPVIAQMDRLYVEGKRAEARDPQEISRNINLLVANQRARRMARQRLIDASEYAMVQLLTAFLDRADGRLRTEVQTVLIDMGPGAVKPLVTALPYLPPEEQEQVVTVLGLIGYPSALPAITELLLSEGTTDSVVGACELAIARIERDRRVDLDPARLSYDLAMSHFLERSELTIFPGEEYQLIWSYNPALGLQMQAIATPVYNEAMAMRLAERAMMLDEANARDAVALWTAANFKREIETPAGYTNPTYGDERRDALYHAVSFGSNINQDVLALAIETSNTQLARRAIEALSKTAGGEGLWTNADGQPAALLAALQYPDRRVQYEAALVLGAAQPTTPFPGAERIVPTLAGAVRDAGDQYALILTQDRDAYNEIRGLVSALGFIPLAYSPTIDDAAQQLADTPGVDLLVIDMPSVETTSDLLEMARLAPRLKVTPALLLASPEGTIDLQSAYRGDRLVSVRQRTITPDMMRTAINNLVQEGAGGQISADESRAYTEAALNVLYDLAISGSDVLDASEAVRPLIVALPDATGDTQLSIADVLAWIDQPRAQVAIMDAALDANGAHQAAMLDIVAGSARRYGNMLDARHVDDVVAIARQAPDREATAAAALLGSLNLPNRDLVPLILEPLEERVGSR